MIHCEAKRDGVNVTIAGTGKDVALEFLTIY